MFDDEIVVGINIIDILLLLLAFYKTIDMCLIKIVIYTRPFIWELAKVDGLRQLCIQAKVCNVVLS